MPDSVPYPVAARALLRDTVLDGLRELLTERTWAKISLTDVARLAGVSRQTLYKEFVSRSGLAQAYAFRIVDRFVDGMEELAQHPTDDYRAIFRQGFQRFFDECAVDPVIQAALTGEAGPELMQMLTLDSAPLIAYAEERLSAVYQRSWIDATPEEADPLARIVVRLTFGYIAIPPQGDLAEVADSHAAVLAPYIEAKIRARNP